MGYPTSAQGMRFSADARWLKCPGGHVRDSVPLLGVLAAIWLPRSHTFGRERVFDGTHGSPGARRAFSGVFSKPGWLHTRRKRLFDLAGSPDGQLGLADGVRRCDSARRAVPQNDADRAASTIRGAAGGGRDAENSGFCTVQAGVRWDGEGCPRLFMHVASKIMQDIGHHATDTQIGRAMRRRSSRPFHVVRESKGEGGYGRAGGPVATGLQRGLHLPWSTGRRGRRRSPAVYCCLPRTMSPMLRPSISRTSSRSKY